MGFLRKLFGSKKQQNQASVKEKGRWSFTRSSNTLPNYSRDSMLSSYGGSLDANKHAIAVAAATAVVAEAALAAAKAAAEVVRLTGSGGGGRNVTSSAAHVRGIQRRRKEELSAIKIQSAFRGYLAKRALRALKALVKLQALVRGHIVRKQTTDMLRRMQTLVRLQARARARASRDRINKSMYCSNNSSHSNLQGTVSSGKEAHRVCAHSTKFDTSSSLKRCGSNSTCGDLSDLEKARSDANWLEHWMEESLRNNHRDTTPSRDQLADDEKSDKILEVDTWKPNLTSQRNNRKSRNANSRSPGRHSQQSLMTVDSPSKLSTAAQNPIPSVSSGEALSLSSPRPGSSGGGGGHFTSTRSESSWGFFNGYSGHPNFMSNTQSSRAKVRSHSAPRQRVEVQKHGSTRRSVEGLWETSSNSEHGFIHHTARKNNAH